MTENQGRALYFLNKIGGGKGLAGAGYTQQRLVAVPAINALGQLAYCLGLVARRAVVGYYFEFFGHGWAKLLMFGEEEGVY